MYFNDQMFNPNTMNPQHYYAVSSQYSQNEWAQNEEVLKAIRAVHDLCEAMKKLDLPHQKMAVVACLLQYGKEMGW